MSRENRHGCGETRNPNIEMRDKFKIRRLKCSTLEGWGKGWGNQRSKCKEQNVKIEGIATENTEGTEIWGRELIGDFGD